VAKNGELFWLRDIVSVVLKDNKPYKLRGIMIDITKQKLIESELIESEARFKALHNASFGGIAIHDKGKILDCNQGMSDMTGYTNAELIGMDGLLLIAEKHRNIVLNNILSDNEKPYEVDGLSKDGKEFPMRVEARKVPYKGKKVRTVEFRDITAQKNAELQIVEAKKKAIKSEKYLENIINSIGDPVFVKDDQSRMLLVNDAFCSLFKLLKADIIGKTLTECVTPMEKESSLKIDKQVLTSGKEHINEETLTLRNKETKIISTRKTRFIDKEGKKFLIGTIRDITTSKQSEKELLNYRDNLEALVKTRTVELEEKNTELNTAVKVFVGRELKIRKLEETITALKAKK
jgi:PAS domain S-box-containing protein